MNSTGLTASFRVRWAASCQPRSLPIVAGVALALPSPALAANLFCPPLFVTDGDQVVCAVANYGAVDRDVRIRMRDGRDGALVEDVLNGALPPRTETGIHHNVVPPDGSIAPAHPVIWDIMVSVKGSMRGSFAQLAGAAVVDADGLPTDKFEDTVAANGGEVVECRWETPEAPVGPNGRRWLSCSLAAERPPLPPALPLAWSPAV